MSFVDSNSQSKRVLLGITDGLASQVCAHLLKLQKYEINAVTFIYDLSDKDSALKKIASCEVHFDQQKRITDFCHKLHIPHQFINISREFYDSIVESWHTHKVEGKFFHPCHDCHKLKLQFLQEEAKKLKINSVATGHLAKVFEGVQNSHSYVSVSNDLENDQSDLICHPGFDYKNLILPLADLTKNDVIKLAKNFGLIEQVRHHQDCFKMNSDLVTFLELKTPKDLLKQGEIVSFDGGLNFGIHEGVHKHHLGESMRFKEDRWHSDGCFTDYDFKESKIILKPQEELKYRGAFVKLSQEMSLLKLPKSFKASFKLNGKVYDCWVQIKKFNYVHLTWDQEIKILKGQNITLQARSGKNAKVISNGIIAELYKKGQDESHIDHHHF